MTEVLQPNYDEHEVALYRRIKYKLCAVRAFTFFGQQLWSFSFGLSLVFLMPDSLLLPALYGFLHTVSIILLYHRISKWVFCRNRLKALYWSSGTHYAGMLTCAPVIFLVVYFEEWFEGHEKKLMTYCAYAVIMILSCVAMLAGVANDTTIGSWVEFIFQDHTDEIASVNTMLSSASRAANILAPIIGGLVFQYLSVIYIYMFTISWILLAICLEFYFMIKIHNSIPALSETTCMITHGVNLCTVMQNVSCRKAWSTYFRRSLCIFGVGLALTYASVLEFDDITYLYAVNRGLNKSVVGIFAAVAAFFEVVGGWASLAIERKLGPLTTGNLSYFLGCLFLTPCIASLWMRGSPYEAFFQEVRLERIKDITKLRNLSFNTFAQYESITMLMGGITFSTFGMRMVGQVVARMFRRSLLPAQRPVVGGVQTSLESIMMLIKFVVVIAIPRLETYYILVLLSFLMVNFGWILFAIYSCGRKEMPEEEPISIFVAWPTVLSDLFNQWT